MLGTKAEVSGNNGMGIHVIFVYTPDFRDLKDAKRGKLVSFARQFSACD